MTDFGYEWQEDDFTCYSTRHMPKVLLNRLKVLAAQTDHSVEWVVNKALDLGITKMEMEVG